jgi:hypothetical protein
LIGNRRISFFRKYAQTKKNTIKKQTKNNLSHQYIIFIRSKKTHHKGRQLICLPLKKIKKNHHKGRQLICLPLKKIKKNHHKGRQLIGLPLKKIKKTHHKGRQLINWKPTLHHQRLRLLATH